MALRHLAEALRHPINRDDDPAERARTLYEARTYAREAYQLFMDGRFRMELSVRPANSVRTRRRRLSDRRPDRLHGGAWFYDQFNAAAGLIARRQGDNGYRFLNIANDYPVASRMILERVVDGQSTVLAPRDALGYDRWRWYQIGLTVNGSQVRAALDGVTVLEATDSTLASGYVGLFTYALGGLLFGDVRVTVGNATQAAALSGER